MEGDSGGGGAAGGARGEDGGTTVRGRWRPAALGRRHREDGGEEPVAGARSGGGSRGRGSGSGGDVGLTPSLDFREQPLEMEETPFFFSNNG